MNKAAPLVSVIIPAYNAERFVEEAVVSVLGQSYGHLELIVVDDGSTDGTPDRVLAIEDHRLRLVSTQNRGVASARNTGLDASAGGIIAFLDADDRWRPGKLAAEVELLGAEPDVAVTFANFVRFTDDGDWLPDQFQFYRELGDVPTRPAAAGLGRVITGSAFESLIGFGEFPSFTVAMTFRASLIKDLRFPDLRRDTAGTIEFFEDLDFCLRAFRHGDVAYLEEPLVEVRRHEQNITAAWDLAVMAKLNNLLAVDPGGLTQPERSALRRRIGMEWVRVGRARARQGERLSALQCYVRGALMGQALSAGKAALLLPLTARPEPGGEPKSRPDL